MGGGVFLPPTRLLPSAAWSIECGQLDQARPCAQTTTGPRAPSIPLTSPAILILTSTWSAVSFSVVVVTHLLSNGQSPTAEASGSGVVVARRQHGIAPDESDCPGFEGQKRGDRDLPSPAAAQPQPFPNNLFALSIAAIALSSLSNLFFLSLSLSSILCTFIANLASLSSKNLILSLNRAPSLLSSATISFACEKRLPVNSSISALILPTLFSAAWRWAWDCARSDSSSRSRGVGVEEGARADVLRECMKLPRRARPTGAVGVPAAFALSIVAVLSRESLRFFASLSSAVRVRMSFS